MKRIVCLGGGPAGLYSAILFKKSLPNAKIEVYERNRPDDTFGWGVVFSDKTMAGFRDADGESHDAIVGGFYHWDDIEVHFRGQSIRSGGHGFCGISRKRLLNIFQERADALGVEQFFQARDRFQGGIWRCGSDCGGRRRQQRAARQVCGCLQAAHRRSQVPLYLARHRTEIPGVHFCL